GVAPSVFMGSDIFGGPLAKRDKTPLINARLHFFIACLLDDIDALADESALIVTDISRLCERHLAGAAQPFPALLTSNGEPENPASGLRPADLQVEPAPIGMHPDRQLENVGLRKSPLGHLRLVRLAEMSSHRTSRGFGVLFCHPNPRAYPREMTNVDERVKRA